MRYMLRALGALALAALTAASPASAGEVLRVGTESDDYRPFNYRGPDGELRGFDIDIAKALCRELDRKCQFVTRDWDRIIDGLEAGDYDCIIASMSATLERAQRVDFTNRYYSNKLRFVGPEEASLKPTASSLEGKTIGVQRETIAAQWLEQNMGDAVDIERYDGQGEAYRALASGEVAAVLADMLVSYNWIQSDAGSGFEFKGEPVYSSDNIAIAVRKGDDELRRSLNEAIAAIREDGTYERIRSRYFPFPIY